jgi:acetyl-CoA C-acetyltransferase
MRNIVIVGGVRTPFGRMGGGLRQFPMADLSGMAVRELVSRYKLDPEEVDAVFLGSALHDGRTSNAARFATLYAGLPHKTSSVFLEMQCGSAIACINHAAYRMLAGEADVVIAAGGESYSQLFAKYSMCTEPYKLIPPMPIPSMLSPRAEDNLSMLQISDNMAARWGVSRQECDEFALRSQMLTKQAQEEDFFAGHVMPVVIPATGKTPEQIITVDEQPRPDTTLEGLGKLRSVLEGGVTTAGNSSGRNDGAAAVLMMTEEKAEALGLTPIMRWVGGTDVGVDPRFMGIGPAFSNVKLLRSKGLKMSDIDVFECNEAFAAQNLSVIREMENQMGEKVNMDTWNPKGGAIAMGHPNGASGARLAMYAMRQLERSNGRYAMISSCCGGGLGVSTLFEKYE